MAGTEKRVLQIYADFAPPKTHPSYFTAMNADSVFEFALVLFYRIRIGTDETFGFEYFFDRMTYTFFPPALSMIFTYYLDRKKGGGEIRQPVLDHNVTNVITQYLPVLSCVILLCPNSVHNSIYDRLSRPR